MSEEAEAVQVAVRMRPFNDREQSQNSELIVRMQTHDVGSSTHVRDEDGHEKEFKYDYSFNSFNDDPSNGEYATQDTVFDKLGKLVINAAVSGRNVCLFAYGQTGSGKTHSMLGKPDQPGIIPRTTDAIFDRIARDPEREDAETQIKSSVTIQVSEVYCEQVNDLLTSRKEWPPGGYKPCMGPDGFHIVKTKKWPCSSADDIGRAFALAERNRSVGSHALNNSSSRAHTIYCIEYEQKSIDRKLNKVRELCLSRINLVDLAGSERTDAAGTSGQMLREGNAINQSLTTLGSCIKALSKNERPNYRQSKLTLLLQGSLTDGKVIMIAAVSPASICRAETLSTLRFADRVKDVKIRASLHRVVNPLDAFKQEAAKREKELQNEIDKLRRLAEGKTDPNDETVKELNALLNAQKEDIDSLRESIREQSARTLDTSDTSELAAKIRAEMEAKWTAGAVGLSSKTHADETRPHLANLHEEPRLSMLCVYPLDKERVMLGRRLKGSEKDTGNTLVPPDVEISGHGIAANHAEFVVHEGAITVRPVTSACRVLVNGEPVTESRALHHFDRLWLATGSAFVFASPQSKDGSTWAGDEPPTFEEAEKECRAALGLSDVEGPEGREGGVDAALSKWITDALIRVEQANLMTADLREKASFRVRVTHDIAFDRDEVAVEASLRGGRALWPWPKFEAQLVNISSLWEEAQYAAEHGLSREPPPPDEDPYVDDDPQLLGYCQYELRPLAYMLSMEDADLKRHFIYAADGSGTVIGSMCVKFQPRDAAGGTGPWDPDDPNDPFVEFPEELLGHAIGFVVTVMDAEFTLVPDATAGGSPTCPYYDTFVRLRFDIRDEEEMWQSCEPIEGRTVKPQYNHNADFSESVTQSVLNHLLNGSLFVQLWGRQANLQGATGPARSSLNEELAAEKATSEALRLEIADVKRQLSESAAGADSVALRRLENEKKMLERELDSVRAENAALTEEVSRLTNDLAEESQISATLMSELEGLRGE